MIVESTVYKIEGRINGIWDEYHVIVSGNPDEVNRYQSEEEAEAAMEELVEVFWDFFCSRDECRADLRVTAHEQF